MSMTAYLHPKCSTCTRAAQWLQAQDLRFQTIDIRQTPPSAAHIKALIAERGLRAAFNTSGKDYRELGLKDKLDTMSTAEAIELLQSNGMLVKRPFLITPKGILAGFKEDAWKAHFA